MSWNKIYVAENPAHSKTRIKRSMVNFKFRATWTSKDDEEATIFSSADVRFSDGALSASTHDVRTIEDLSASSDFDN